MATGIHSSLPVRALMFVLKYLVPALVLFLLLNMLWMPNVGRFSCNWVPWFIPQAQADSGECPGSLRDAWNNAEWAMIRYQEIAAEHRTTGLYYDEYGKPHKLTSGDEKGADAERARDILRTVGAPSIRGHYPSATHVEVKVAAIMRENGAKTGVIVINHPGGPCRSEEGLGLSCQEVLPLVLPPGATLRVWHAPRRQQSDQVR